MAGWLEQAITNLPRTMYVMSANSNDVIIERNLREREGK